MIRNAIELAIDGQRLDNGRPEDGFVETGGGNDVIVGGDNAFLDMFGHAVQIGPDNVTQIATGGQGVNLGEHLGRRPTHRSASLMPGFCSSNSGTRDLCQSAWEPSRE